MSAHGSASTIGFSLLLISAAGHAEINCKAAGPECSPCKVSEQQVARTEAQLNLLSDECFQWSRESLGKSLLCIDSSAECVPDYERAANILRPLQCVRSDPETSGGVCDLTNATTAVISNARKEYQKASTKSSLVLDLKGFPDGALADLKKDGSQVPWEKVSSGHYRLLDAEPGSYNVYVTKDSKQLAADRVALEKGKTTLWTVTPKAPPAEQPKPPTPTDPNTDSGTHIEPLPDTKKPSPVGVWGAATMVFDEHFADSFGARGELGATLAVAKWIDLRLGGVGSKAFWGGLLGATLMHDVGPVQLGFEPQFLLLAGTGNAHRDSLWGLHFGGRVGYRGGDFTYFFAPALEYYPKAAPYDGFFAVASFGVEWRKQ